MKTVLFLTQGRSSLNLVCKKGGRLPARKAAEWLICMKFDFPLDRTSYEIGMINCFIEMVACGVKPLAISPPLSPDMLPLMEDVSKKLSDGFHTKYYVESSLMITDIQSADFTRGKCSILYYKDDSVLRRYLEMKECVDGLMRNGTYSGQIRRDLSIEFGQMLGYPMAEILHKVDSETRIDPITCDYIFR